MAEPRLSVIVTHSADVRPALLGLCMQTLDPRHFEVLLVEARRRGRRSLLDRSRVRIPAELDFAHHRLAPCGRATLRNRGVSLATGDVVVLLAGDFHPNPRFLEAHRRFHALHPEPEDVAVGPVAFPRHRRRSRFERWLDRTGRLFGVAFDKIPPGFDLRFFYAGNASLKREFLARAGPSDEDFPAHAWDDYELSLRLFGQGMRTTLIRAARADHMHRVRLRSRMQQMREAGEAAAIFDAKYPSPHPWHEMRDLPLSRLRWRRAVALLRYRVLGSRDGAFDYFESSLDAAFARAYQRALPS